MGTPVPDSKTPVLVAVAIAVGALILGIIVSSGVGKLLLGLLAACGAIPAAIGMWKGIQQQTQGTLAMSLGALVLALGCAAVLLIWGVIVIAT